MKLLLEVGQNISSGRYRLQEKIEAGGQAEIWKAHSIGLEKSVALKITVTALEDFRQLERRRRIFEHERNIANHLSTHENIVKIHDFIDEPIEISGHKAQVIAIVMEFLPDGDLTSRIGKSATGIFASKKSLVALLKAIASVLMYAHNQGVIHCDLKPENILLVERPGELIPKLMDFGVSLCKDTSFSTPLQQGGTPEYMAPELFTGEMCTEFSDIYALGLLFFEICFQRKPYKWTRHGDLYERSEYYKHIHTEQQFTLATPEEAARLPNHLPRLIEEMFFSRKHRSLSSVIAALNAIQNELIHRAVSNDGTDEFPFSGKFRWRPIVHQKVGKTLFYIFFKGHNPQQDLKALPNSLRTQRLGNYCCYQVIGRYDYIVRLWASPAFRDNIRSAIEGLQPADYAIYEFERVVAMNGKPCEPPSIGIDRQEILRTIADIVIESNGNQDAALELLQKSSLVYGLISFDRRRIGFFTLLQFRKGDQGPLNQHAFEKLGTQLCEILKKQGGVKDFSFCMDKENTCILIKYALGSFRQVGTLMQVLLEFGYSNNRSFHTKIQFETFVMMPGFVPELNDDGALPLLVANEIRNREDS